MSTGPGRSRRELETALNQAMRDVSAKGVLHSQAVADRLGVNSSDLECLDFVALRGPLTAGELADAAGLTTGAITGVIDRLEKAGFARRTRDRADRRKVLVAMQPAAMRRLYPLFQPMERAAASVLSAYADQELVFLLEFLERIGAAATTALAELRAQAKPGAKSVAARKGTRKTRKTRQSRA